MEKSKPCQLCAFLSYCGHLRPLHSVLCVCSDQTFFSLHFYVFFRYGQKDRQAGFHNFLVHCAPSLRRVSMRLQYQEQALVEDDVNTREVTGYNNLDDANWYERDDLALDDPRDLNDDGGTWWGCADASDGFGEESWD